MSTSFQCAEGAKLTGLNDYSISRSGYTFDGWYEGSTKYTADSVMPNRDLTLTAKWIDNTPKCGVWIMYEDSLGLNRNYFNGGTILVDGIQVGTITMNMSQVFVVPIGSTVTIYGKSKTSRTTYYQLINGVTSPGYLPDSTYGDMKLSSSKGIQFKISSCATSPYQMSPDGRTAAHLSVILDDMRPAIEDQKGYGVVFSAANSATLIISKPS